LPVPWAGPGDGASVDGLDAFGPRVHGFHFANDLVDKAVIVPGYGEVATDGRCGGMAFAALDYWSAGLPVPSHRPDNFPDRAVPEDGTRLADVIHKRLFDSYATWSARQLRDRGRARPRGGRPAVEGERRWGPWRGLFLQDYAGERPPYRDGHRQLRRRRRLPVGAGLLARHPPGEPGRSTRSASP
jgi:hypothetical protein